MAEEEGKGTFSLLSDKAILRHIEKGTVVIEPFTRGNLSTSSYDVTLGPYYFKEAEPEPGQGIYNPYNPQLVKKVWGEPLHAETAGEWCTRTGTPYLVSGTGDGTPVLANISPSDRIIWIRPGETILAHTNEFIGGKVSVTGMMKARSSLGRNFIEVCKCAGWGDIGYVNRWTMVGRRIAQIVFFDSEGIIDASYEKLGKYQTTDNLELLKKNWSPNEMLPKMYKDKELHLKSNDINSNP